MNKYSLYTMLCAGMVLFFSSCNYFDSNSSRSTDLLTKPPYKGLTDSIRRFPEIPELYLNRAVLLSQNDKHELANSDYKKAYELTPNEATAWVYISNLFVLGRAKDAVGLLKESIKKYPDNTQFIRRLSEHYAQTGNYDAALEQCEYLLQKDSSDFEAWYEKGLILKELNDTAAAIDALEKSFALQPINYSGLALAEIYASLKNPRALEICNYLIERDTTAMQFDAIFAKGMYYAETKQYAEAIQQFDECIKHDWKNVEPYIEKGIILFQQSKYGEALKVFEMSATVSNTNADSYFWMGRCYEATGDKEEARLNYERAIALDRNFSQAREGLRRVRKG